MTQTEWFEKNGFNEQGETYAVIGDSYSIKDQLKEMGYKYSSLLKWHGPSPMTLPAGFTHITFRFDDLYKWDPIAGSPIFYAERKKAIEQAFIDAAGPSMSQYVGTIGGRLKYMDAIYTGSYGYSNNYGYTHIHNFESDGNVFTWFTTKTLNLERGARILLSGTVKKHEEYKGVKTTLLTRCLIRTKGE